MADAGKLERAAWELLNRRLEPVDLAAERFDGEGEIARRRLFIFAQPRSASYSFCRFCAAAGWGIPTEYLAVEWIRTLSARILADGAGVGSLEDLDRYVLALERCRSRNGVFAVKVMWEAVRRFERAYRSRGGPDEASAAVYLRRRDFPAQVVSFVMQQSTGVYSVTDVHRTLAVEGRVPSEGDVRRAAEYLIKEERRWLEFFAHRKLHPAVVETEDLLGNPIECFDRLAALFQLELARGELLQFAPLEADGSYRIHRDDKDDLRRRCRGLLSDYEARRRDQFSRLSMAVGASMRQDPK